MPVTTVLIPLPHSHFDPTHVVIAWQVLRAAGIQIVFTTADGQPATADPLLLSGEGLDFWGGLPVLRQLQLLGLLLRADSSVRKAYPNLVRDPAFSKPKPFSHLKCADFDGLLLPGGQHANGMRAFLENASLQRLIAEFFAADKPVAAIAHGVLLAARSHRADGRSVLFGRKATALPWGLERDTWNLSRFLGRFWEPGYFRTYPEQPGEPEGYRSVEAEVTRALAGPTDFLEVPHEMIDYLRKASGLYRDSLNDSRPAWVVCDGNFISARWAGDAHTFAKLFVERLLEA